MAPELNHLLKAAFNLIDTGEAAPTETVRVGNKDFRVIAERHEKHGWIVLLIQEPDPVPSDYLLESLYGLTERQSEVARYLVDRLSNREMAERLGVAEATAARHTECVMRKIGVSSRNDVRVKLLGDQCAG